METLKKAIYSNISAYCIVVTVFVSNTAVADIQVTPLIIEQNREQQKNLDSDANRRLEQRPSDKKPQIEITAPVLMPDGQCTVVKKIFPYGADQISDSDLKTIFKPVINLCVSNEQIAKIANQLQTWYLKAGYITTRVSIKHPQNSFTEKGNLEIWVVEGQIGNFILGKNSNFDNSRIKTAFPVSTGDVLNIHDLDQGLEQLNTLFSQKFRMQIKPADRPGYSDIILLEFNSSDSSLDTLNPTTHANRQQITLNYSNGGIKSTGEDLYNVSYSNENLLGYNDVSSLAIQRALPEYTNKSETIRFNTGIPFGYWNFGLNYYFGNTVREIKTNTLPFLSKSEIQTTLLSINRVLTRSQSNKLELNNSIEFSERKSFINDTLIQVTSRQISSINFGLAYTQYFPSSTLIVSPTLSNGVALFGAIKNAPNISKSEAHAEYNIIKLNTYYRQQFLAQSRYQFALQNAFNGQYSNEALYGEKQFVLGGEYSVRGFKENVMSSDNGVSLRNDIIVPIGSWMLPWSKSLVLAPLNFKLFYDIGEGFPFVNGKRKSISGWGYSLNWNYKWFSASYTAAEAIISPDIFIEKEGWINYLSFNAKLRF